MRVERPKKEAPARKSVSCLRERGEVREEGEGSNGGDWVEVGLVRFDIGGSSVAGRKVRFDKLCRLLFKIPILHTRVFFL